VDERKKARAGRDPIEERREEKRQQSIEAKKRITFEVATRKFHEEVKALELRSEKGRATWLSNIKNSAFPVIGDMPLSAITRDHVLSVLKPIWPRPSAVHLRTQIEAVLEWATVNDHREGDNPAAWKTLKYDLPAPSKAHKVSHLAALPYVNAGAFLKELREKASEVGIVAAAALEFLILSAARSGEVRGAMWDEIDLDAKLWTIPAERMKANKLHRVPLNAAAIAILEKTPKRERTGLLFGVPRKKRGEGMRPLHDYEVAAISLGRKVKPDGRGGWKLTNDEDGRKITVHGWRSAFKDWARTCTSFADEVSELALAHVSSDATRAAYARDELLDKRSRLMAEWAEFLEKGPAEATITDIGRARRRR
jgi:integrase